MLIKFSTQQILSECTPALITIESNVIISHANRISQSHMFKTMQLFILKIKSVLIDTMGLFYYSVFGIQMWLGHVSDHNNLWIDKYFSNTEIMEYFVFYIVSPLILLSDILHCTKKMGNTISFFFWLPNILLSSKWISFCYHFSGCGMGYPNWLQYWHTWEASKWMMKTFQR